MREYTSPSQSSLLSKALQIIVFNHFSCTFLTFHPSIVFVVISVLPLIVALSFGNKSCLTGHQFVVICMPFVVAFCLLVTNIYLFTNASYACRVKIFYNGCPNLEIWN